MKDKDHHRAESCRSVRLLPTIVLGFLFVLHPSSFILAQTPPLVGQPTADYYGAHGSGVKVAWSLDRTTVPEDEAIVATLTVTGATNPQLVVRPDLKTLSEFQNRFIITDQQDMLPAPGGKEVRFSYQLRPRNRSVDRVPTLKFRWYNPAAGVGKQFPTARAEFVPITVTEPAPKPQPPVIPLNEPEHLFAITTGPAVLGSSWFVPATWAWLFVAFGPPVLAGAWYLAWRRVFPGAAQQAHLRRSRAARHALQTIHRANRTADPAGAVAAAVLGYLHARFLLPSGATTPSEVRDDLAELEVPASDRDAVAGFLRKCDEARFAPFGVSGMSLAADAEVLIARLETA